MQWRSLCSHCLLNRRLVLALDRRREQPHRLRLLGHVYGEWLRAVIQQVIYVYTDCSLTAAMHMRRRAAAVTSLYVRFAAVRLNWPTSATAGTAQIPSISMPLASRSPTAATPAPTSGATTLASGFSPPGATSQRQHCRSAASTGQLGKVPRLVDHLRGRRDLGGGPPVGRPRRMTSLPGPDKLSFCCILPHFSLIVLQQEQRECLVHRPQPEWSNHFK